MQRQIQLRFSAKASSLGMLSQCAASNKTGLASRVCLVAWMVLQSVVSVQGQSPQVGSGVFGQPSPQPPAGGLSSKDYLRMMEQANERSGISATGGNYRGAHPRPTGSLDQPVPNPASPAPYTAVESYPSGNYNFGNPNEVDPSVVDRNVVNPNAVNYNPANHNVRNRPVGSMSVPKAASFDGPRWTMRYSPVWIHRSGDENLTYTQGTTLSPFGADFGSDITVGYMANPMDSYEFSFLGSLRWNRSQSSVGPVNASLVSVDPEWLTNFTNASQQQQVQSASYRSYGLHKRWLTDEINNYRVGCEVIEYAETLSLNSQGSASNGNSPNSDPAVGTFNATTGNSLFGWSGGLEHWRPMGEKFSIGGAADAGLYINSAESTLAASSGTGINMTAIDDEISLASMFSLHLRSRYQLSSNWTLYGGYRWWVLTGIATVDDQDHRDLLDGRTIATSSDDSILFHGADAGIEWRF